MEQDVTIRDPMGGVNQSGLRDHNERLVLSLIQRHGALPSAEAARRANLSAQTASIIIRGLEADGLLTRGASVKGKVGKPSVPMMLHPDGILSLGLNIGRKSVELVLIDILGTVRAQAKQAYAYPTPETVMTFLTGAQAQIIGTLTPALIQRLAGIGVAAPFELWNWLDAVNAPKEAMSEWRDFDLAVAVAGLTGLPVFQENDATAACLAEHLFGRGREFADYAYFFIGSFVGGGVVLNDAVYSGRTGNAGAFGTLPVRPDLPGQSQLLHQASIYLLERRLEAAGKDPRAVWDPDCDWQSFGPILDEWIGVTARALALGAVAVSSVIDFERVLIEGNCPPAVRARLVEATRAALAECDLRGITPPLVQEALVGRNARAIGAASLPISARYLLNQPVFR